MLYLYIIYNSVRSTQKHYFMHNISTTLTCMCVHRIQIYNLLHFHMSAGSSWFHSVGSDLYLELQACWCLENYFLVVFLFEEKTGEMIL